MDFDTNPSVMNPKINDAQVIRQVRVKPELFAAYFQASVAALYQIYCADHSPQMDTFRGSAALHVFEVAH